MTLNNIRAIKYMRGIRRAVLNFFILSVPVISFSQISKLDIKSQRLLLQLGAGYLNVARQNQIDLDSGLALASNRIHLNPMVVMGEGLDEIILNSNNEWVVSQDISGAKRHLLVSNDKTRIQLLTLIGSYYSFQPEGRKNDIDSALIYLLKARQEAESANDTKALSRILACMGKCYLESGNLSLATATFTEAVSQTVKSGDKGGQAMALLYWAAYSPFQVTTIAQRIDHLKTASNIYRQTADYENGIIALTDLGYLSFASGKIDEAEQYFLKALALETKIGFQFKHYTSDLLAMIAVIQGQFGSSLKYALGSIKTANMTGDRTIYAYLCDRVAISYSILPDKQQEVFEWSKMALSEFEKIGDGPSAYKCVWAICGVLNKEGRSVESVAFIEAVLKRFPPDDPVQKQEAYLTLAESYCDSKNFETAEKYITISEQLQSEVAIRGGSINLAMTCYRIADVYYHLNQFENARLYFNRARAPGNGLQDNLMANSALFLAQIDSSEGRYLDAYLHAREFIEIDRKLVADKQTRQIQDLKIQYETDKKDSSIKILNQEAALQKAVIQRDKLTRGLMFAGAALLILFLGLLYNRYRLKQRSNKLLQHLVDEKEFLLKEIHHRVKNNLQIVISLLNTQSKFLNNEEALAAISESRHRMQAMSLIHQKLYQSENVAFVGMQGYIRELVDYMDSTFKAERKIRFDLDIDPIDMDISQAIPVGLILNEAITNCIKHAFTDQSEGIIKIKMKVVSDQMIFFEISDNGKGMSADTNLNFNQSMGMRLIRGLIEQIGGEMKMTTKEGFSLSATFRQDLVLRGVAI